MMRTIFLLVTLLWLTSLAEGQGQAGLRRRCRCNNFVWTRRNGVRVGNCFSRDFDGNRLCYLNQPNRCPDAIPSRRFCGMEVTKIGCGCRIGPRGFCLPVNSGPFLSGRTPLTAQNSDDDVENAAMEVTDMDQEVEGQTGDDGFSEEMEDMQEGQVDDNVVSVDGDGFEMY